MVSQRRALQALTVFALLGLALLGWTHLTPAHAQDAPDTPRRAPVLSPNVPTTLTANADFIYMVRGGMLYQLHADDLSLVRRRRLATLERARIEAEPDDNANEGPRPAPRNNGNRDDNTNNNNNRDRDRDKEDTSGQ